MEETNLTSFNCVPGQVNRFVKELYWQFFTCAHYSDRTTRTKRHSSKDFELNHKRKKPKTSGKLFFSWKKRKSSV